MALMLEGLRMALEDAPIVKIGEYQYFINPLQGVAPPLQPDLLIEIARAIVKIADLNVDRIVTAEAMGIHISSLVSVFTGIPLVVFRKKGFGLPDEIEVVSEESYRELLREHEIKFYLNSIRKGDRILVIDDVMSRGGTMLSIIDGIEKAGAIIKDILVVINRGNGPQKVKAETGYNVKTLADVELRDGKLHILKMMEIK